jgi:hypothetical protein
MKVLLISANTEKLNMPTLPLGLACVAAATQKAGHDVTMVDLLTEEDSKSGLKGIFEGFRPDLIGISVRNIDDQNMENPRFLLEPVKEYFQKIWTDCLFPIPTSGPLLLKKMNSGYPFRQDVDVL